MKGAVPIHSSPASAAHCQAGIRTPLTSAPTSSTAAMAGSTVTEPVSPRPDHHPARGSAG